MTIDFSQLAGFLAASTPIAVAIWAGLTKLNKSIEKRGYDRARAESYQKEADAAIQQLRSELAAKAALIVAQDLRLQDANQHIIPALRVEVLNLTETVKNLSGGQE